MMRSILHVVQPRVIVPAILVLLVAIIASLFFVTRSQSAPGMALAAILERLPVYPQAQDVSIVDRETSNPSLNYRTIARSATDRGADVLSFYRNWFLAEGWQDKTLSISHSSKSFVKEDEYYTFE